MERQDVHTKLAEAKFMRRRVDEDSKLLANRIALLKLEESKALKKIEETKKKTQEIIENRVKLHREEAKLESLRKKKDEDYLMKIESLRNEREKIRNMKTQNNKYRLDQAMQEINALKVLKKTHLKMIEIKKFEDLSEKVSKKNRVKEQYKSVEEKKRKVLEEKIEKYKLENLKKADMENQLRRQKEENLLRLEKLEMELIQRLQNTQLLQRNAYEDLETALSGHLQ